jgi:hypothetical protein
MKKYLFTILTTVSLALFCAASAQAQATRTWVSGVGDDANPCSRTAPCKTFAGAISKTAPCGEISVLDPGGFGAVTITKSITIDGTGTLAGIVAAGSNAVIINAAATDTVTLRGISINGVCSGLDGVRILQAKNVNIEDCVIYKFSGDGIEATDSDGVNVNLRNTVIRDNGEGINAASTSTAQEWSIEHCSLNGNSLNGIHAKGGTRMNVRESVIAGNIGDGVQAQSTAAGTAVVSLWDCQIFGNNSDGVQAGIAGDAGTGIVRIALNMIIQNTGIGANKTTAGTIETFSNNMISGNATNGCPSCTATGPGN